jgi:hypothetical protein
MAGLTFEQLRLPAALVLVLIAAFVFMPREGGPASTTATVDASDVAPVAGEPRGAVTSSAVPELATPIPTITPSRTPRPTATTEPTAEDTADDGFAAEILACRSISGSSCVGELGTLPGGAATVTALVRFTDASAGDVISVTLSGAGGTIAGGPYTLGGSGTGYYYSTFNVGGLPGGDYSLIATRNGTEVATTEFRRGG